MGNKVFPTVVEAALSLESIVNVAYCPISWLFPPSYSDFNRKAKMALNALHYLKAMNLTPCDVIFKFYHVGMQVGKTSIQLSFFVTKSFLITLFQWISLQANYGEGGGQLEI